MLISITASAISVLMLMIVMRSSITCRNSAATKFMCSIIIWSSIFASYLSKKGRSKPNRIRAASTGLQESILFQWMQTQFKWP
jgi:hypothetical protein